MLASAPMTELYFKDPRDYMKFEYELRRARRPSYSMRAFARDLSLSPSSLNDFMQVRVGMSDDRISKIATKLNWNPTRTEHFKDLIVARFDRSAATRQSALMRARARTKDDSHKLSLDAFKTISDWYHLALLELCTIRDGMTSAVLASELKISAAKSKAAVQRLLRLELLKETAQGLKPDQGSTYFGDGNQSQAIKTFHSQILELAQQALNSNESVHNDSQSFIYSVPSAQVGEMLTEVRKAVMDVVNRYALGSDQDCIQAITVQSFPIWRELKSKGLSK